jgi:hypothetical protein
MVHAVHDSISPRVKKRSSLRYKSKKVKEALPKFIHGKHFVGRVSVKVKSLAKKREEPMGKKK